MRDATALVIPSLHEGFGLPVAEGLAAGAVVLHSDLSVLRETSAGAALTFAPRSIPELAACLRQAAGDSDLTESLRTRGLERARSLTWDAAVETTLAAYRAALGK
jgi:alpha-1,3-rhamnosyl/mannosyltransferase